MKMKRVAAATAVLLMVCAVLLLLALPVYHQTKAQSVQSNLSRVGGLYMSQAYSGWGAYILSGNSATGSQTITVCPAFASLPDGRQFSPFLAANATFSAITVDPQGSVAETVTPTAVSIINAPAGASGAQSCANVTASFSNVHGSSYAPNQVISGDQGIQEALNDASLNGGGLVYWTADTGSVTLNTGALTTTTAVKVPANFLSAGASGRVTTTITTSASWAVGISGSTSAFLTANSTLTAGTTGIANMNSPATVGTTTGLTAILFTMGTSNPGAGAIHARVWGYTAAQSTF
jgi:hypothetical protein